MSELIRARSVLAVQDLERSTRYFTEVLGFSVDPIRAPGWSFLSRGPVLLMLGECPDEVPARETGNHAWFLHILVEDVDFDAVIHNRAYPNGRKGRVAAALTVIG